MSGEGYTGLYVNPLMKEHEGKRIIEEAAVEEHGELYTYGWDVGLWGRLFLFGNFLKNQAATSHFNFWIAISIWSAKLVCPPLLQIGPCQYHALVQDPAIIALASGTFINNNGSAASLTAPSGAMYQVPSWMGVFNRISQNFCEIIFHVSLNGRHTGLVLILYYFIISWFTFLLGHDSPSANWMNHHMDTMQLSCLENDRS